jgi:hypothetical protein
MTLPEMESPMVELPPTDRLVSTRESLHRVAEHVLAAALNRASGQFALRVAPGGFATPPLPDGTVLAVHGTDLVVERAGEVRRTRLTTVREAAAFAGTEPGYPTSDSPPATPDEPDAELAVDERAAAVLADWYALGDLTLMRWAVEIDGDGPTQALLYPEHFDLGSSAGEVNYGFSPGDTSIELPYVYVGPWAGAPVSDDFWNAGFGAYRTVEQVEDIETALAFLRDARSRLARP